MVVALLCLTINLPGQIQIGIKSVYSKNLTTTALKEFMPKNPNLIYQIRVDGIEPRKAFGLSVYVENDKLFFNSDVMLSETKRQFILQSVSYNMTPLDPEQVYDTEEKSAKLIVNSGYRWWNLKVGVGPEFSYNLSKRQSLTELEAFTVMDSKLQSGFNFMVGYIFKKHIHLDLKYTYMFQDISHEFEFESLPMEMRTNPKFIEIGLGLFL